MRTFSIEFKIEKSVCFLICSQGCTRKKNIGDTGLLSAFHRSSAVCLTDDKYPKNAQGEESIFVEQ